SRLRRTSGARPRSDTNGLPGEAWIMKKATATTRKSIGMEINRRRRMNFMGAHPAAREVTRQTTKRGYTDAPDDPVSRRPSPPLQLRPHAGPAPDAQSAAPLRDRD